METLFSGIQPTGKLHIGNYIGAIQKWIKLQEKYSCIYSIVDLHALTTDIKADELKQNIFDLTVDLLALGIDPKKTTLFQQSKVQEHTELAWLFNCVTPISELQRMTQFKDKAAHQAHNINTGLFAYPVLQAADILLYQAKHVPVGEDQVQHIELTRIIARKFNNRFGDFFVEPAAVLSHSPRVMSLNDSDKKMSKSLGESSYIAIRDDEKTIAKKIKKAVTDDQGIKNLLELYSYFGKHKDYQKALDDYTDGKLMNSELKDSLAQAIIEFLNPVQEKIKNLESDPDKVYVVLKNGEKKAQEIANKTMAKLRKKIGLE